VHSHPIQERINVDPIWYGIGDDWRLWSPIDEALEGWEELLSYIEGKWNFNTVRLSFSFPNTNMETHTPLNFTELEMVLNVLDIYEFKAIIDCHNWMDSANFFGSPEWYKGWIEIAERFTDDSRIVAYGLFNEPFDLSEEANFSGCDTRHSSVEGQYGVLETYGRCIDAIRETGDNHTIVLGPPTFMLSWDDAMQPELIPEEYRFSNTIIPFHSWITTSDFGDMAINCLTSETMMDAWISDGWNIFMQECGMLIDDEFSRELGWDIDSDIQAWWFTRCVRYCFENDVGFNVWLYRHDISNHDMSLTDSHYRRVIS